MNSGCAKLAALPLTSTARTGADGAKRRASQSSPPQAANKVKSVNFGGVYVEIYTSRAACVDFPPKAENSARSGAHAVGRASPYPTASLEIAPAQFQVKVSARKGAQGNSLPEHISRRRVSDKIGGGYKIRPHLPMHFQAVPLCGTEPRNYSAFGAPTGQFSAQAPQSMHFSGSIT